MKLDKIKDIRQKLIGIFSRVFADVLVEVAPFTLFLEIAKKKFPLIAVDGIIEYKNGIILVERRYKPIGLAIPGGFIESGEEVEKALKRELKEETNLEVQIQGLVGVYSHPQRDPRAHVITLVFACKADDNQELRSGDDAKEAKIFKLDEIPFEKIVFDHGQIIKDYIEWKRSNRIFIR